MFHKHIFLSILLDNAGPHQIENYKMMCGFCVFAIWKANSFGEFRTGRFGVCWCNMGGKSRRLKQNSIEIWFVFCFVLFEDSIQI